MVAGLHCAQENGADLDVNSRHRIRQCRVSPNEDERARKADSGSIGAKCPQSMGIVPNLTTLSPCPQRVTTVLLICPQC